MPPYLADVTATLTFFFVPACPLIAPVAVLTPYSDLRSDNVHTLETPSYIPEERACKCQVSDVKISSLKLESSWDPKRLYSSLAYLCWVRMSDTLGNAKSDRSGLNLIIHTYLDCTRLEAWP